MSTMTARLLDSADALLEARPGSSAFRRRAISTAYYAVFHAIARLCADYVTHGATRSSPEYVRAYRALDHGSLKAAFAQTPLRDDRALLELGRIVVRLQADRHKADYHPPFSALFGPTETREIVSSARQVVGGLARLSTDDRDRCRLLATCLLFKERRS